jgi:hypothetical protein
MVFVSLLRQPRNTSSFGVHLGHFFSDRQIECLVASKMAGGNLQAICASTIDVAKQAGKIILNAGPNSLIL